MVLESDAAGNQAVTFRLPVLDGTAVREVPFEPPVTKPPICCRSFCKAANADGAPERFPACKSYAGVLNAWVIGLACWEEEDCELSTW